MSSAEGRGRLRRFLPEGIPAPPGAVPPPAEEPALWWHEFDEPGQGRAWTGLTRPGERISVLEPSADADAEESADPGVGPELEDDSDTATGPSEADAQADADADAEEEVSFEQVLFGPLAVSFTAEERHLAAWQCYQQLQAGQERYQRLAAEVDRLLRRVGAVSDRAGTPAPVWADRLRSALADETAGDPA